MLNNLYYQGFSNISINEVSRNFIDNIEVVTNKFRQEIADQKNPIVRMVNNSNDIVIFENIANKIKKYSHILLLGVGGSCLGAKLSAH